MVVVQDESTASTSQDICKSPALTRATGVSVKEDMAEGGEFSPDFLFEHERGVTRFTPEQLRHASAFPPPLVLLFAFASPRQARRKTFHHAFRDHTTTTCIDPRDIYLPCLTSKKKLSNRYYEDCCIRRRWRSRFAVRGTTRQNARGTVRYHTVKAYLLLVPGEPVDGSYDHGAIDQP